MSDKINDKEYLNALIMNLDDLAKRLQDNYNDGTEFKQTEEDRLAVYDTIEYLSEVVFKLEHEK